jgi:hypothetical protein
MKHIVLSLSAVTALAGCTSGPGTTPGDTVQEFTRRLDQGECVGIKDFIAKSTPAATPGGFGEEVDVADRIEEICTRGIEERKSLQNPDRERLKQVNILNTQENGDNAILEVEFENRAGEKQQPQSLALVRQDERWRIDLRATAMLNRPSMAPPPPTMEPPAGMDGPATPPSMPAPADNAAPKTK